MNAKIHFKEASKFATALTEWRIKNCADVKHICSTNDKKEQHIINRTRLFERGFHRNSSLFQRTFYKDSGNYSVGIDDIDKYKFISEYCPNGRIIICDGQLITLINIYLQTDEYYIDIHHTFISHNGYHHYCLTTNRGSILHIDAGCNGTYISKFNMRHYKSIIASPSNKMVINRLVQEIGMFIGRYNTSYYDCVNGYPLLLSYRTDDFTCIKPYILKQFTALQKITEDLTMEMHLNKQINSMTTQLKSLKTKNTELNELVSSLKNDNDILKKENVELTTQLKNINRREDNYRDKNVALEKIIENQTKQVDELTNQIDKLNNGTINNQSDHNERDNKKIKKLARIIALLINDD